jgi:hypothetical protein
MSLVDSDHIIPARERHGAHYKMVPRWDGQLVPGMTFRPADELERFHRCTSCSFAPFFYKDDTCPKCGGKLELE